MRGPLFGPYGCRAAVRALRQITCDPARRRIRLICPVPGKFVAIPVATSVGIGMSEPTELFELAAYLVRTSRLTRSEAVRLIDEVLSFLDERPEEFVCRRHRELRAEGLSNTEI